jgi:hypothetical protein
MAGLEGARLGSWLIQRRIGTTGDIYLAQSPDPGTAVALKIIPRAIDAITGAKHARLAQTLAAQVRTLAGLNQPNVLPVYDFGEQDGTYYLAMAYVPDGSLADVIGPGSRRRLSLPLAPPLVASIVEQAAAGLQAAHDQGILHGNIKPSNLLTFALLDADQPVATQVQVFVADFGTADFATRSAAQVGDVDAPLYVAPEQDRGQAGFASDQYALACVAYLLLTGRPAFAGSASMTYGLVPVRLPPPSHINASLPPAIDAALARALAADPRERYPRVADLAQALRVLVGTAPAAPTGRPRTPPWLHMTMPMPAQPADTLDGGAWPEATSQGLMPIPHAGLHPLAGMTQVSDKRFARRPGGSVGIGGSALTRRQLLLGAVVAGGLVVVGGVALNQMGLLPFGMSGDSVGIYQPANSIFVLKADLGTDTQVTTVAFGRAGDLPVVGNWTGRGFDTVGVFRPSTGTFYLLDANQTGAAVAHTVAFGQRGDVPITGDWAGKGRDGIGVFRPATRTFYLKTALSSGPPDYSFAFGRTGDIPLAGDWHGDGATGVGVYRPANGTFYLLRTVCNHCAPGMDYTVRLSQTPGAHDLPFTGDWSRAGVTGLGLFRPASGTMLRKNDATHGGAADRSLSFGQAGDIPLGGRWA